MHLDKKGTKKLKLLIFGLGILAFILIILIVPKAKIQISLNKKFFAQKYQFKVQTDINSNLPSLNIIPAQNLNQKTEQEFNQEKYIISPELNIKFKKKDLEKLLIKNIKKELENPENIDFNNLDYQIKTIDPKSNLLQAYLETWLIPKLDQNKIKEQIQSKNKKQALENLKSWPEIKKVKIQIFPNKFFLIPLLKSRIKIIFVDN